MLTAAEYFDNLQAATFADRMARAADVTDERLAADVANGALTEAQRRQVVARRAELADEDVAA